MPDRPHRGVEWTRDEVMFALRYALRKYGRPLSTREWLAEKLRPSPTTIRARFGGSWDDAWASVGVVPDREITAEQCLQLVRRAWDDYGHFLTVGEWERLGLHPTPETICKKVGASWAEVWKLAGAGWVRVSRTLRGAKVLSSMPVDLLRGILSDMPEDQRYLVEQVTSGRTLADLGRELGLTREGVRLRWNKALEEVYARAPRSVLMTYGITPPQGAEGTEPRKRRRKEKE